MVRLRARVSLAHEQKNAAAFAGHHAIGADIVGAHVLFGQRLGLGKANDFKGIKADVHAASEHQVLVALNERIAGEDDAEQG
jgi:hypothetical protein